MRGAEAEAGHDLLGHRGAAEHVARLQDEGLQAGAGEVRRAHQPVVAAADDDRVVALGHVLLRPIQTAYESCKSSRPPTVPAGG